ncbi:MAG: hypothetical protein IJW09_01280 [Clostridia bacterium]|nr:hypothetical protein [Clostridia bacterium]
MTAQKTRTVRLCVIAGLLLTAIGSLTSVVLRPDGLVAALIRSTHVIWPRPAIFGTYHLIMLGLCLGVMVAIALLYPKFPREWLDDWLFGAGVVLFVLELYKQLYHLVVLTGGAFNFGILPLQFCSYSLYLYLLIPLLPQGRCKEALLDFVALYQTMGGCIVMGYPTLYAEVALSLHTMLWHIVMIGIGVLVLLVRGYKKPYVKEMLPATVVFVATVGVAVVLNFALTPLAVDSLQPLNLFYISPYIQSHYIIIGDVQRAFGWAASVVVYVLMFILIGANTVWLVGRGIKALHKDC